MKYCAVFVAAPLAKGRSPHGERGLKCFRVPILRRHTVSLPARGAWIEIYPLQEVFPDLLWSLPARGAWIEIHSSGVKRRTIMCRSPHGERGLKYHSPPAGGPVSRSLPARGAWIEIGGQRDTAVFIAGRSPHGERGLKCWDGNKSNQHLYGRSPHGERGLK